MRGGKNRSTTDWQGGINPFEDKLDSVEGYWATHFRVMQKAAHDQAIYMFKEGVMPAWEDPAFVKGASVSIGFSTQNSKDISKVCFELACVRLVAGEPGAVIGVGWVARTSNWRVELWSTSDAEEDLIAETRELLNTIKEEGRNLVGPDKSAKVTIDFKPFSRQKSSFKAADADFETILLNGGDHVL